MMIVLLVAAALFWIPIGWLVTGVADGFTAWMGTSSRSKMHRSWRCVLGWPLIAVVLLAGFVTVGCLALWNTYHIIRGTW